MLVGNALLVLSGLTTLASARIINPGIQFFAQPGWKGPSTTVNPVDSVCTSLWPNPNGSMKMLGDMECAFFFATDCTWHTYKPRSKYRHGPSDNTDKYLSNWLDLSSMNAGDREQSGWAPQAFICRSFFDNLLKPDSSSKNTHISNDGWHGNDEKKS